MFIGLDYKENLTILKEYLKNFDATVPTLYKQYSDLCEEGGVSFSDFGLEAENLPELSTLDFLAELWPRDSSIAILSPIMSS